jgi:hypothetical protein
MGRELAVACQAIPDLSVEFVEESSELRAPFEPAIRGQPRPTGREPRIWPSLSELLFVSKKLGLWSKPPVILDAHLHTHAQDLEDDPLFALTNNVLSVYDLCDVAAEFGVGKVVLIAPRTGNRDNIKDRSVRIAENLFLEYALAGRRTKYSIVRVPRGRDMVVERLQADVSRGKAWGYRDDKIRIASESQIIEWTLDAARKAENGEILTVSRGERVDFRAFVTDLIQRLGLTEWSPRFPIGEITFEDLIVTRPDRLYEEAISPESTDIPTDHPYLFAIERKVEDRRIAERVQEIRSSIATVSDVDARQVLEQIDPSNSDSEG